MLNKIFEMSSIMPCISVLFTQYSDSPFVNNEFV